MITLVILSRTSFISMQHALLEAYLRLYQSNFASDGPAATWTLAGCGCGERRRIYLTTVHIKSVNWTCFRYLS